MDAEREITRLLFRYAQAVDGGDFDAVGALFAHGAFGSGAVRDRGEAVGQRMREVVVCYDGVPSTKHVTTNVMVDVGADGVSANARSYFTVFQSRPDFPMQAIIGGRYSDRFELADGQWRFTDREVLIDLLGDLSRHLRIDVR